MYNSQIRVAAGIWGVIIGAAPPWVTPQSDTLFMELSYRSILLVSFAACLWLLGVQPSFRATNEVASSGRQVPARDPGWPREVTRNSGVLTYEDRDRAVEIVRQETLQLR